MSDVLEKEFITEGTVSGVSQHSLPEQPLDVASSQQQDNEMKHNSEVEESSVSAEGGTDEEESEDSEEESEEDSEDSEDDDEDDDEDEDEDEEPRLKYNRITQLPKTVFNQDPVSACLVADTFFVFATHGGIIHLTNPDFSIIRSYRAHRASILGLSTDGVYLASASIDGTVVIGSVNDPKDITASDFKRPVHSVALDPNYKSTKTYISGGMAGEVILSERGWLGQRSDTVLQKSEDPVIAVYWIEGVIIWMNDSGINIYSQYSKKLLLNIPRPEGSPRGDLYKPRLTSPESNRIYIAWADRVWNLKITVTKNKDPKALLPSGASIILPSGSSVRSLAIEQTVTIESAFHVDCLVAGLLFFKEDTMIMLSYLPPPAATSEVPRPLAPNPEIRLIDIETGNEVYGDELALKGFERLGMNDYHLCQHSGISGTRFLIVSARDGIVAMERDLSDKVAWLIEHHKLREAWELAENVKAADDRYNIGLDWIESLIEEDKWTEAAEVLEKIQVAYLETNDISESNEPTELTEIQTTVRDNWDRWGWIFSKAGHTDELAPTLPSTPLLPIEGKLYETVLNSFIDEGKLDELLLYLQKWSVELYDFTVIKRHIEDVLKESPPQGDKLRKTLADLYISSGDPLSAVHHLLVLHDPSVLSLVSQCHLLPSLLNEIPDLLTVNLNARDELDLAPLPIIREAMASAISMVVSARHEVTPDFVVKKVMKKNMEVVAFLYLEQLNAVDTFASQKFGDLQARLYAEFDRPKLIGFLKKNSNYNLEVAAQVCESRNYIPELVYILGKVGQNKRALKLVLEELQDPEQAIDFAKQQNDQELWDEVLDYSISRPSFLRSLLDRASDSISPSLIIARIPMHMEIPGLKVAISRIFSEHELVLSLNKGILEIVNREAQVYASALRAVRTEGTLLDFTVVLEEGKLSKIHDKQLSEAEKYSHLDFSQTIVLLPDGKLANEAELIGVDNVWNHGTARGISTFERRSMAQKLKHLAYIRSKLESFV